MCRLAAGRAGRAARPAPPTLAMTTSGLEDPARRVYDQMRALYSAVRAGDAAALKDVLAAEEGEGLDLNHTSPALLGEFDQCCLLALAILCFGKPVRATGGLQPELAGSHECGLESGEAPLRVLVQRI